jgi:very-short-patch-repair endonuclease
VLEVDGGFHMDVEEWEDDIARQRALAAPDRILVRCTSRELRDEPERVARDLITLGVPRAA